MPTIARPTLNTPRLQLRPVITEDAMDLLALWRENAAINAIGPVDGLRLEDAQSAIGLYDALSDIGIYRRWAVLERQRSVFVGECEVWPVKPQIPPLREWTLGYGLIRSAWGRGYMREAVDAVLDHVFARPDTWRVKADVLPDNLRSRRLLYDLGFECEGLQRQRAWGPNGRRDEELWALTRARWERRLVDRHGLDLDPERSCASRQGMGTAAGSP